MTDLSNFEELATGQAFEYDGKVYFKATSQNNEDCGFCVEDSEVRFTFPHGVKELSFANYDINEAVENEYHKSKSNGRRK